jgi:hypothetical protein
LVPIAAGASATEDVRRMLEELVPATQGDSNSAEGTL